MNGFQCSRPIALAFLFIKEQFKEPVGLFWAVLSPVATFYVLSYARDASGPQAGNYVADTSWFYAYISSNVAFFGFAFYLVGRRESGFVRSFIFTPTSRSVFLTGQFLACSVMSIIYCFAFYGLTRFYRGSPDWIELLTVLASFYVCFLLFSIPALLLTLAPVGFQNASTLFSVLSFTMLVLGVATIRTSHPVLEMLKFFNPMWWANELMLNGVFQSARLVIFVCVSIALTFLLLSRYLLINPVWSRY